MPPRRPRPARLGVLARAALPGRPRAALAARLAVHFTLISCLALLPACGGGSRIDLESENPLIGSPFPVTLLIPARAGGDRAWVQTSSPPLLGAFAFDLDWVPPPLRADFFDLSQVLAGVPDSLVIEEDRDLAFVTVSGRAEGVFVFDPANAFQSLASYTYTGSAIVLPEGETLPDSAGNPLSSIRTVFTSGAALLQGKLFLSSSNYLQAGFDPVCAPGTVRVVPFLADEHPPRFEADPEPRAIFTTGYNPTEVTPFEFLGTAPDVPAETHRVLLVTNSGVLAIRNGQGVPLTGASVDVVDPDHECVASPGRPAAPAVVATYPLGLAAPAFSKVAVAAQQVTVGERTQTVYRGYLGSAAYDHVYELDLTGLEDYLLEDGPGTGECPQLTGPRILLHKVLAPLQSPILATANSRRLNPNLVHQVVVSHDSTRAYATGFNTGTLAVLQLSTDFLEDPETGRLLPLASPRTPVEVLQITDPLPTLNESSPGPLAVRPGVPGIDFQGPDLFVVTGSPVGELRSVTTY